LTSINSASRPFRYNVRMNGAFPASRGATPAEGLSAAEAARRLASAGPNELPRPQRRGLGRIVAGVFREPMFLLLALAAIVYLAIGGIGEGLLMAAFAALSILLVIVQEKRSEDAIEALRALATPLARVIRDGREQRMAAREVVPGDLLLVAGGERVAADAALLRAEAISVDESLLTGESVPVAKAVVASADIDDERGLVFASTLVTAGRGLAEVLRTGARTEAGRIGASLAAIEIEPTLLQRSFGRLVRTFAILAGFASALVVLLYGLIEGEWLKGMLSGIALGMSVLPEEFPMILVVFVALGARRLAKINVLARRTAVIEVLGACSMLCLDKTGTLTENRMTVAGLAIEGTWRDVDASADTLPQPFAELVRDAAKASARTSNDPMDDAVHRLAARIGALGPDEGSLPIREYGLTEHRPAVVRVWRETDGMLGAFAKGAPEAIAAMCKLDAAAHAKLIASVEETARHGARVLAVARGAFAARELPDDPMELPLALVGLVAFVDPLRASARRAIAAARRAGVAIAMITGDHPATAAAIARAAGIESPVPPVTGAEIAAADDETLRRIARSARIFARVRPDEKLRLVRAFKDNGEIVAMTGDGVNDAPALKAAHIGLAMGGRGTDVAREAAAIVLLEDDLGHLVDGIAMGRRIFDNLRKASIYIAAIHVTIAGLTLLPLVLGMPALLLPLHVVLIEMVIDPICAIAFENEPVEPGTMDEPPRRADEQLLGWPQLILALLQGTLLLVACLGLYAFSLSVDTPADTARALAFVALTAGNLALIRVVGTRRTTLAQLFAPNHGAYWLVAALAAGITAACLFVPGLERLFQFGAPAPAALAAAIAIGLVSTLVFDLAKRSVTVQRILGRAGLTPRR
jgi:Ca2+-transporting ATPase